MYGSALQIPSLDDCPCHFLTVCPGDTKVCSSLPLSSTLRLPREEDVGAQVGSHDLSQPGSDLAVWRTLR